MQRLQMNWRDVRVGLFVTLGLVIMIFMVLTVGTNILAFSSKFTLKTFVPNVVGLNPGAFVTIAGIKAGTIGDFEYMEKDGQFGVSLALYIEEKYRDKITATSRVTIRTLGILGDKYVEISLGRVNEPPLEEDAWVPANTPLDFEKMVPKAENILDRLPEVLTAARDLLTELKDGNGLVSALINDPDFSKNISQTAGNLSALSKSMNNNQGSFAKLMNEPEAYNSLMKVSDNLNAILEKIQAGEGSLGKMVADSTLYTRLTSVARRTDSLFATLNDDSGTAGKLLNDTAMHDRLIKLLVELDEILLDVKKYPQKYFQIKVF